MRTDTLPAPWEHDQSQRYRIFITLGRVVYEASIQCCQEQSIDSLAISDRMAHLHLLWRCGPLAQNRRRRLHRILCGHYRADEPPLDGVAGRVQEVCQLLPLCRRQLLLGGRPMPRRIFARNVLFKAQPSVAPDDASGLLLCAGAVVAEQCLSCLNERARPAALLALIPSPLRGHPASLGGSIATCASLRKMRPQPYCQSHARAFPTSYFPVQNSQIWLALFVVTRARYRWHVKRQPLRRSKAATHSPEPLFA